MHDCFTCPCRAGHSLSGVDTVCYKKAILGVVGENISKMRTPYIPHTAILDGRWIEGHPHTGANLRRTMIRSVLVPACFASVPWLEEYAPPVDELCFLDVQQAGDNLACVVQKESVLEGRSHSFR